jgi:hypothetical protein
MHAISNGYRGIGLLIQLGADRIIVPLAIALSLMAAAALSYRLLDIPQYMSPSFY